MKRKPVLFSALLMVLPVAVMAQEPTVDNSWDFAFFLEDDWFFGHTDRYYTNGPRLSWTSPDIAECRTDSWVPRWCNSLVERSPFTKEPGLRRSVSLSLGQNMYIPEDKRQTDLIRDDRPYAGVTYGAVGLHAKNSRHMESLELAFGIVGPHSYAGDMQEEVHELIDSAVPNGWNNQLEDEPIVNIFYERTRKSLHSGLSGGLGYDVLPFL